ncbi:hypothetical protein CNMCM5793_005454 [Aspergillus hiratsukae]|uniref:Uncharacterized protein n=1 Tax=Aspergillus hiratsukae TaxID=1194566 RepID=A0A8H6P3E8_9EURO|nr:hypothetical protein CNMCM5793_005454 [Aspergillus hiratsukae]KAF7156799.1 hypothetical protein CNMCM6106_001470 [Aspergillus hiratsukae]
MSQNMHINLDRFSAQALGYNLLRQHKADRSVLSERPVNGSRNVSNRSRQSQGTHSTSGPRVRHPSRQPSDPPQGALAQADAGFARFLKEHASPKHQRVTAGGRIVPMDSQSPAPQMKLSAIDQTKGDRDTSSTPTMGKGKSKTKDKRARSGDICHHAGVDSSSPQPQGILATHARLSSISMNDRSEPQISASTLFPDIAPVALGSSMMQPNAAFPLLSQQFFQFEPQFQEPHAPTLQNYAMYGLAGYPFAFSPSMPGLTASNIIPFMSSVSQAQSSGLITPSDIAPCSSMIGGFSSNISQSSSILESFVPNHGPQGYHQVGGQMTAVTQPLFSMGPFLESSLRKSLSQISIDYAALSTQLTSLDRYMAMHTWDMDPCAKKSLVEQRKSLVRELDAVRSYKEQLEATLGVSKEPGNQKETGAGVAAQSNNCLPQSIMTNQFHLEMPSSASQYGTSGFSMLSPVSAVPPVLPADQPVDSYLHWQTSQNVGGLDNYLEFQNLSSGWNGSMASRLSQRHGNSKSGSEFARANTRARDIAEGRAREDKTDVNDGWTSFSRPTLSELRGTKHMIGNATRKVDPVNGLIQGLSRGSIQSTLPNSHSYSEKKAKVQSHRERKSSTELIKGAGTYRPVVQRLRRPWASEVPIQRVPIRRGEMSSKTDEDVDSKSSSSYTSTTDSWATGLSEDKHSVGGVSLHQQSGNELETHQESRRYPNLAAAIDTVQTAQLSNASGSNSKSSQSQSTIAFGPHPSTSATSMSDLSEETNSVSAKQANPQLLTQYLNKDHGLLVQKTTALAVSQNVNAHAFLAGVEGMLNRPYLSDISHGDDTMLALAQHAKLGKV